MPGLATTARVLNCFCPQVESLQGFVRRAAKASGGEYLFAQLAWRVGCSLDGVYARGSEDPAALQGLPIKLRGIDMALGEAWGHVQNNCKSFASWFN